MKLEEIKPGMIVQLQSGGPDMTVQFVTAENNVFCKWFVGPQLHEGLFIAEALRLVMGPV